LKVHRIMHAAADGTWTRIDADRYAASAAQREDGDAQEREQDLRELHVGSPSRCRRRTP
jgi:hypothetical protein